MGIAFCYCLHMLFTFLRMEQLLKFLIKFFIDLLLDKFRVPVIGSSKIRPFRAEVQNLWALALEDSLIRVLDHLIIFRRLLGFFYLLVLARPW